MNKHDTTQQRIAELEEQQRQQQEFISMIVHQIRTPLSGTKWTLKMLLDGDLAHFSPEQLNILKQGYESNERMVDLLEELSRANKAQVWTFEYSFVLCDLEELLEETITQFLAGARSHHVSIKFDRPDNALPSVQVDKDKMKIIFEHLVENAIKYTPAEEEVLICLKESPKNDYLLVRFHNPGTTVKPQDIDTIFEKYTRGSLAQESNVPGTGMGLFTVRKIIQDHGGDITFESSEQEGTTIEVKVPLK